MSHPTCLEVITQLWLGAGLPQHYLDSAHIRLPGASKHVLPSSYRIGCAAQTLIAATALAASLFRHLTQGSSISVTVDARHAALEFASERLTRLSRSEVPQEEAEHVSQDNSKRLLGLPSDMPADWDPLAGWYECAGGRHIRLHTNWPHHKLGLLKLLGLQTDASREQVATILRSWDAGCFEIAAIEAGMCAFKIRTGEEWQATEAGQFIQSWLDSNCGCPFRIIKVRSGRASRPEEAGSQVHSAPRSLRILDMSRVIAGPVAGRILARHGADVLLVSCLRLPRLPLIEVDTARGKRTAEIDLSTKEGKESMRNLLQGADVLSQAYRPGALSRHGLGFEDLLQIRPGLIYSELDAFGFSGPWKDIRGFDSLTQGATGMNLSESDSYRQYLLSTGKDEVIGPKALPCQALDHGSGCLVAFGILAAKCRSLLEPDDRESGWRVQVSLAATAAWLASLGRVHGSEAWEVPNPIDPSSKEVRDLLEPYSIRNTDESLILYGIRHAAQDVPLQEQTVTIRLDADEPQWKS